MVLAILFSVAALITAIMLWRKEVKMGQQILDAVNANSALLAQLIALVEAGTVPQEQLTAIMGKLAEDKVKLEAAIAALTPPPPVEPPVEG